MAEIFDVADHEVGMSGLGTDPVYRKALVARRVVLGLKRAFRLREEPMAEAAE